MSGDTQVVEDFFGVVQLLSDGSVVRGDESVIMPAGPFPDVPGVQWKDVVYDAPRSLKLRVYRPPPAAGEESNNKLLVLVYFHGGGYCIGAYDQPMFHSLCQRFAAELPAVVLSVQYCLAPEHRLPAAIDDGAMLLSWLRRQAELGTGTEPWLVESVDFSRTFVSSVSAGANLAHHVVVRVASGQLELGPVRVVGFVLFSPFFGSVERVTTESDPPAGAPWLVEMTDQAWRMALPVGATRDHPLAAGQPVRPGQPQPRTDGAATGARRGARPRHSLRPRAALRGKADGDGKGCGARRVQRPGACLLRRYTVGQGERGANPNIKAVCVPKLMPTGGVMMAF